MSKELEELEKARLELIERFNQEYTRILMEIYKLKLKSDNKEIDDLLK